MTGKPFNHAVVIGSGMAGLVTSRVLSEHFKQVTVLERDAAPEGSAPRPGVPQGWHFHGLLPGGLMILRELFPSLTDDLKAAGSLQPAPDEFFFLRPEGKSYLLGTHAPKPRRDDGSRPIYVQTRALLESCVRAGVCAIDNIELRYRARVEDVIAQSARVTGIQLESGAILEADLVIDAMGRGGRTLHWLDKLGFERPVENVVHCDFAYTSLFMRPHDPDAFKQVGFFIMSNPKRGGSLVRMENGLWLASIAGRHGDYPPRELAGFLSYAESIGEPYFYDLLKQAEPISEPASYRFNQSVRRRFEQLERFPEGLLPIGDSVCHYNPLYGQGMSAACRQAMALRRILSSRRRASEGLREIWRDFLPEAYQETRAPWLFAARSDFADPRCRGDFPSEEQEILDVLECVMQHAGAGDPEAIGLLLAVQSLALTLDALRQPIWLERAAAARAARATDQSV